MTWSAVLANNVLRTFVCTAAVSETADLAARSHGDLAIPASRFSLVPDRSYGLDPSKTRKPGTLFDLPPMSERYLTGLLAVIGQRETVFGVTTYLGAGHKGIIAAIEATFGPINTFLWGGEIHVRRGVLGVQVLAFNQTSGELYQRQEAESTDRAGAPRVRNSLLNVRQSFARQSPVRIAAHARLVPFTRQSQHLHPWLAGYGRNFRHDLNVAFSLRTLILPEQRRDLQEGRPQQLNLRNCLHLFTDLETFARLIEEEGTFHPRDGNWFPRTFGSFLRFASRGTARRAPTQTDLPLSLQLRQYIEKIQRGDAFTLSDYDELTGVLDALWQFFTEHTENNNGNVYDLYQIA